MSLLRISDQEPNSGSQVRQISETAGNGIRASAPRLGDGSDGRRHGRLRNRGSKVQIRPAHVRQLSDRPAADVVVSGHPELPKMALSSRNTSVSGVARRRTPRRISDDPRRREVVLEVELGATTGAVAASLTKVVASALPPGQASLAFRDLLDPVLVGLQ